MCNNSLLPLMPPSSTTQHNTTQHNTTHGAHLHSDNFFFSNRSTKSSTSRQQSDLYAQQPARRWLLIFGDMLKPWLACFPRMASRQPAVPTALQRPSAPPHSYGVTPAVVFTCSHPKQQVDLSRIAYLKCLASCALQVLRALII